MPNFTPTGKVRIGRVPFDNSYRHTLTFADAAAQEAYFASVCTQALEKDTYTYVRMNNSIRVQFNAEQLYTYDYVMYQNRNYGTKWFYAFIVGVNYINENTTELVLELDVMQTWYFDYQLAFCFVEREHVNDDTIGAHLNPEPEMPFNLICKNKFIDPDFDDTIAIVQTNAIPTYGAQSPFDPENLVGNKPVSGGVYSGIVNGAALFSFYADNYEGDEYGFWGFLNDLNHGGGADSVSNIYMFPSEFINGAHPSGDGAGSGWETYMVERNENPVAKVKSFARPTSLDNGFEPKNNKLFTYPYCFVRVEDNAGHFTEWKYELWGETSGEKRYAVIVPVDPDATAFVVPMNYDGETNNYENCLTFPCTAKASWVYSAYQTWSAQNHLANTFNALASVAAIAIPAAKGISLASGALGVGVRSAANIAAKGGNPAGAANILQASGAHALNSMKTSDYAMMGGGALGLGNLISTVNRQSKVPNTVRGSASGNSLYGVNRMTYNMKAMVIQEEFAKIIDDFFDMYGYQVDRVKIPNREGRKYWNYVKCQNSCHHAKSNTGVPASDMEKINSIYDAGITFWHPWNGVYHVGNYSMNNIILNTP